MDFLLVLIELFSLGVTAEALQANVGSTSAISLHRGLVDEKISHRMGRPLPTIFSQKTRLDDLSCGLQIFLSFCHNALA